MTTTPEVKLNPETLARLGYGQWMHEATDKDGNHLYTSVSYRGRVKGDWTAYIVRPDGSVEKLDRVPNIRAKKWTPTKYGSLIVEDGRD